MFVHIDLTSRYLYIPIAHDIVVHDIVHDIVQDIVVHDIVVHDIVVPDIVVHDIVVPDIVVLYQLYLETLKHVRKETKKLTTGNDINPPLTQRVAKH